MMKRVILLVAFITVGARAIGQGSIDTAALKQQLSDLYDRDQKTRTKGDSAQYMTMIDSMNQVQVIAIIDKYGWPGKSFVGVKGNLAVYAVIQHADLKTQQKYMPLLQQSVNDSESRPVDLAYMQDRVLMREGKPQIYGSQVVPNNEGGMDFYPIQDELNVNVRRKAIGLQPIEEYAKYFGIEYKIKKSK